MFSTFDKRTIRFLLSSTLATFLEFLDFGIYCAAMSMISHRFFPDTSNAFFNLFLWGSMSIGFLVRPLGAILFGHIGDRFGCKKALILSIFIMSFSTLSIALLPSFQQISYFAPLLLILFRICQGLGISPEYNGAGVYIMQQPHLKHRRGFLCSFTVVATLLGYLVGSWIIAHTSVGYDLNPVSDWCWQGPLIVTSIFVGIGGIILRVNMNVGFPLKRVKMPFLTLIHSQRRQILTCCFLSGFASVASYILGPYLPHYLQSIGYTLPDAYSMSHALSLFAIICGLFSGILSDKINRIKIMQFSLMGIILSACGIMIVNTIFNMSFLPVAIALAFFMGTFIGPLPAVLVESFYQEHRYTGAALGHNIGVGWIGAGTAHLGLQFTMQYTGINLHLIVYPAFVAVGALILITCVKITR